MSTNTLPRYIIMNNFAQHKRAGDVWCSPPFYSCQQGYKMRLVIYANGYGDGEGTHVSVFVQIVKGEYDDILTWPYTGTVSYEINWKEDRVKKVVDFSNDSCGCGKRPRGEGDTNKPCGPSYTLPHFILIYLITLYILKFQYSYLKLQLKILYIVRQICETIVGFYIEA